MTQDHAERAHAKLSASGSKKWLTCTPSVKLEEGFEDKSSDFAAEGTLAHELSELILKKTLNMIDPHEYKARFVTLSASPFFNPSMIDYIHNYAGFVMERINVARATSEDAVVMLEQRLDFSQWVPDGFGTGDVVIVCDNVLEVIDLKYGKGVRVEADDNSQLMLYGLGAYAAYGHLYNFDEVRLTIVQPRLDSISSADYMLEDLLYWGDSYVYPRANMAVKGEGDFVPGEHCRFCKAKAICRARAETALQVAKHEFKNPDLLTTEEIADVLEVAKLVSEWTNDIEKYALEQAERHGIKFPGWKLVEGRSNRKYTDPDAIASRLLSEGFSDTEFLKPRELLGITELEKQLGKKQFATLVGDYIMKASGKPTLVPLSDKRPEMSSTSEAVADFQN